MHLLHAADDGAVEIAFAPVLPVCSRDLNCAPLTQQLKTPLHRQVSLVSASDYRTFYLHIQQYEFPVIVSIANAAYLAWANYGYSPLLQPDDPTRPAILLPSGHTLHDPAALSVKKIT